VSQSSRKQENYGTNMSLLWESMNYPLSEEAGEVGVLWSSLSRLCAGDG
jgi:hypothetical protein